MAVFAAEAAFYGKPAIVGSYYSKSINQDIDPQHIPPSCFIHPNEAKEAVRKLVLDRAFREDLGRSAQTFVLSRWSARRVASRYLRLLDGTAPPDWFYSPQKIEYLHGCGLTDGGARHLINKFIRLGGKQSLCLSDKIDLQNRFIAFSNHQPVEPDDQTTR
jgi:hypothetical protein